MKLSAAQPLPTNTPPATRVTVPPAPPGRSPAQHRRQKDKTPPAWSTHPAAQPHVSSKHQREVSGTCQRHEKHTVNWKRDAPRPSQRNVHQDAQRTVHLGERSEPGQGRRRGKAPRPATQAAARAARSARASGSRRRSRQGNTKRNDSQGNDQPLGTGSSTVTRRGEGRSPESS